MRVAVAGKGGAGKTTLVANLARTLARSGWRVNALDDDPNPNLAAALGISAEESGRLRRAPADEIMVERVNDDGEAELRLTRSLDEVIDEYGLLGPDGVRLLAMTGLLGAGRG